MNKEVETLLSSERQKKVYFCSAHEICDTFSRQKFALIILLLCSIVTFYKGAPWISDVCAGRGALQRFLFILASEHIMQSSWVCTHLYYQY